MKKVKLNITKEKSNLDIGSMFSGMAGAMGGMFNNNTEDTTNENAIEDNVVDGEFKEVPNEESIPVEFSTEDIDNDTEPVFDTELDNKDDPEPILTVNNLENNSI